MSSVTVPVDSASPIAATALALLESAKARAAINNAPPQAATPPAPAVHRNLTADDLLSRSGLERVAAVRHMEVRRAVEHARHAAWAEGRRQRQTRTAVTGSYDPFDTAGQPQLQPQDQPHRQPQGMRFSDGEPPARIAVMLHAIPRLGGDVDAAVVLSQVAYYLSRSKSRDKEGCPRTRLSWEKLAWDTCLSKKQVKRCIGLLVADGLITRRRGGDYRAGDVLGALFQSKKKQELHLAASWMAGSLTAGLVLMRICWHFRAGKGGRCRAHIVREGQLWVAKSHGDLAESLLLGEGEPAEQVVRRVIRILEERGLVETRVWGYAGRPTVHIRLQIEVIQARRRDCYDYIQAQLDAENAPHWWRLHGPFLGFSDPFSTFVWSFSTFVCPKTDVSNTRNIQGTS